MAKNRVEIWHPRIGAMVNLLALYHYKQNPNTVWVTYTDDSSYIWRQ